MADKKTELMAKFYAECQQKGYADMTDDTQSLKAKVIATDLKLNYGNIIPFYEKAKGCYEQVQKEKAEAQKQRKLQQQKESYESARRKVNGELLVTLSDQAYESEKATLVRVYIRSDNSIYYTINNGSKIEGAPKVSIMQGGAILLTYHPSRTVYTGATVGGITTGGIHHTQSGFTSSKAYSDKADIEITAGSQTFTAALITMSDYACKLFKRDQSFKSLVRNKEIKCYVESSIANAYYEAIKSPGLDYQTRMNALSMAAEEQRLSRATCERIINLLGRIVYGQFPPSDEQIYASAEALENASSSAELNRAIELFNSISDYRDAAKRAQGLKEKYEEVLQTEKEQAILEKEAKRKRNTIIAIILAVIIAVVLLITQIIMPLSDYKDAMVMMESGSYDEAITFFKQLGDYKDAAEKVEECIALREQAALKAAYEDAIRMMENGQYDDAISAFEILGTYDDSPSKIKECVYLQNKPFYDDAIALEKAGNTVEAAIAFGKLGEHDDARERSFALWDTIAARKTISIEGSTAVGIRSDGTVVVTGYNASDFFHDVAEWSDIVDIAVGDGYILGLKKDGTLAYTGWGLHYDNWKKISEWTDIVSISSSGNGENTVGLKSNGTVVAVGENAEKLRSETSDWSNIIAVSASSDFTVGLKSDGTVVAAENKIREEYNVSGWTDIVAISAGIGYTVGLKSNGTVVVTGGGNSINLTANELWKLEKWTDIVAIAAGYDIVAGLKSDGSVVILSGEYSFVKDLSDWADIVEVAVDFNAIGLMADGTVVVDGRSLGGSFEHEYSFDWTDIKMP